MPTLTVKEAAAYVRLGVSTLNALRVKGGGPVYTKLRSRVRYETEDLDAWKKANKRTSTSDEPTPTSHPRRTSEPSSPGKPE